MHSRTAVFTRIGAAASTLLLVAGLVACNSISSGNPEYIKRLEEAGFENVELADDLDRPHLYRAYAGECIVYAFDSKSLGETDYYGQHIWVERHSNEIQKATAQMVFDRYPDCQVAQ